MHRMSGLETGVLLEPQSYRNGIKHLQFSCDRVVTSHQTVLSQFPRKLIRIV